MNETGSGDGIHLNRMQVWKPKHTREYLQCQGKRLRGYSTRRGFEEALQSVVMGEKVPDPST